MSKSENNSRHRLIRIYQMLQRDSDMQNPMIITDILPKLEEYGIETCRDSVREDLKAMKNNDLPWRPIRGAALPREEIRGCGFSDSITG